MEKFQELRDLAKKKIQVADHILTMTYPIVKDARLLLAVVENIFLSLNYAMSSVLYHEMLFKRISPFPDNFTSKFDLFKDKCVDKYKIDKDHVKLMQDLKEIVISHKKSPVEFQRKDNFVICDGSYRIKSISASELKDSIAKAKSFILSTTTIISRNEEMLN